MRNTQRNPGGLHIFVRIAAAVLIAASMLFTAGCGEKPIKLPEIIPQVTQDTKPVETPPETNPEQDASLNGLRQAMAGTAQLFAVAYFGYHETQDSEFPVDPFAIMQENAFWLCEDLPFLLEIPQDRIVGETGELFCIVPLDENATVAVSKGYWDEENQQYIYDDILYSSSTGEPILLFCNNAGWEPDTQLYISGPSGEVFWYPQIDDNGCAMPMQNDNWENLFYDFSSYRELLMKRHRDMKDSEWVMPTAEMLAGTIWSWDGFLKDGREVSYRVTFEENILSVLWNDGTDERDQEFLYAQWELAYDEGFAILSIDFREMAGVLRYNLLYHEVYEQLYVAMDVVQEEMNIGWEPLYRFLMQPVVPEPVEMIGTWERAWTEMEGDRSEAEPGECTIEIRSAASSGLLMSYVSRDFPDNNFQDELLTIDMRQMHILCGNDEWVADLDYVGPWDTTYTVTLTADDILIKQNYFLVDGALMVSYEYFRRFEEYGELPGGNMESPYEYALSQGGQAPELSELTDSFWLSQWCGYALELAEDSVPNDNGGWAMIYDVNENGAYTQSYSGSWRYEDGMLYLSLVPEFGDGVLVDDSFPVLMLDGQLWVGRNSSGLGLPHFYSDTLADTLQQPVG